tara:strand:- start:13793 stop:14086 length:294 start_codon:yes stop_codon:yes gene_type:complete
MLNNEQSFDGTTFIITESPVHGLVVSVTEGELTVQLVTRDGLNLYADALTNTTAMKTAGTDRWVCDRIAYVFSLAASRIVRNNYGPQLQSRKYRAKP